MSLISRSRSVRIMDLSVPPVFSICEPSLAHTPVKTRKLRTLPYRGHLFLPVCPPIANGNNKSVSTLDLLRSPSAPFRLGDLLVSLFGIWYEVARHVLTANKGQASVKFQTIPLPLGVPFVGVAEGPGEGK
jgi:hypothetical protein